MEFMENDGNYLIFMFAFFLSSLACCAFVNLTENTLNIYTLFRAHNQWFAHWFVLLLDTEEAVTYRMGLDYSNKKLLKVDIQ